MMSEAIQATIKFIEGQEALAKMILENSLKARKELGLVQDSTRPSGSSNDEVLSETEIMKIIARRRVVRSKKAIK